MRMLRRPGTLSAGGALRAWELQWAAWCSVVMASLYSAMPPSLMVCSLRATAQTEVGITKKCGSKVDSLGHCRNWWPEAAPRSPASKLTVRSATAVCAGLKNLVVRRRSRVHTRGGALRCRAVHGSHVDVHDAAPGYSECWWRFSCVGNAVAAPCCVVMAPCRMLCLRA